MAKKGTELLGSPRSRKCSDTGVATSSSTAAGPQAASVAAGVPDRPGRTHVVSQVSQCPKKPKITGHVSFGYVGVWVDGEQVFEKKTVDRDIREGESIADIIGQMFLFPDPPPSPAAMTPAPRKRVASREVKRIEKG